MAVDQEIERQVGILESGGRVLQETRLFNVETGETVSMRSKEHAHDYRYFPEPDLVPLRVSDTWLSCIQSAMPELPTARRTRFVNQYQIRPYVAQQLTHDRPTSEYFEQTALSSGDPQASANWILGELTYSLKEAGKDITNSPVSSGTLGNLVGLVSKEKISGKLAKEIFPKMFTTGKEPDVILAEEGLTQISDEGALVKIIDEVIAANPKQLEQYRSGKTTVMNFFLGQVMKASRGQADPAAVTKLLKEKL